MIDLSLSSSDKIDITECPSSPPFNRLLEELVISPYILRDFACKTKIEKSSETCTTEPKDEYDAMEYAPLVETRLHSPATSESLASLLVSNLDSRLSSKAQQTFLQKCFESYGLI
jgi:hypothetical protein